MGIGYFLALLPGSARPEIDPPITHLMGYEEGTEDFRVYDLEDKDPQQEPHADRNRLYQKVNCQTASFISWRYTRLTFEAVGFSINREWGFIQNEDLRQGADLLANFEPPDSLLQKHEVGREEYHELVRLLKAYAEAGAVLTSL